MRLLVLSDPHGARWKARDMVTKIKPDVVIVSGDIPSSLDYPVLFYSYLSRGGRRKYIKQIYQRFLTRLTFRQIRSAKRILVELSDLDVPVLIIHGNTETPETRAWLHLYCHRVPNFHWLSSRTFVLGETQFVGHGWVDLDPQFNRIPTPGEVEYDVANSYMNRMQKRMKKKNITNNILISHAPPLKTKIDFLRHKSYHAGSRVIRNTMDKGIFSLAVSGHLHESWGIHESKKGWWGVNAGSVVENRACSIDTDTREITWWSNVTNKFDPAFLLYTNRVRVKFDKTSKNEALLTDDMNGR